jgi:hypothetical protein
MCYMFTFQLILIQYWIFICIEMLLVYNLMHCVFGFGQYATLTFVFWNYIATIKNKVTDISFYEYFSFKINRLWEILTYIICMYWIVCNRNKVKALCLKLCCSLSNQFLIKKIIITEEKKWRNIHSCVLTIISNTGKYVNFITIHSISVCE